MPPAVTLRPIEPADLDIIYAQQLDPEAIRLAAFVRTDAGVRAVFDAHWAKILGNPDNTNRVIIADGQVAGHVACIPIDGQLEVTYWLGREFWGRGIATAALAQLLRLIPTRPIRGRCAADNPGSLRVLQKCGFKIIGQDRGFAPARGQEIEETVLELER